MSSLPAAARYVVIGAGVHGLSTSMHLASRLRAKGATVGANGTRIVVGADGRAQTSASDEGSGYVFERFVLLGNVGWPWRQDLQFPGSGNVNLGRALTMSRNMAVLGWPSFGLDGGGGITVFVCDAIFVHGFDTANATRSCAVP